jgi:hypothetical protein
MNALSLSISTDMGFYLLGLVGKFSAIPERTARVRNDFCECLEWQGPRRLQGIPKGSVKGAKGFALNHFVSIGKCVASMI